MKICPGHWIDCRAAIASRGLEHLIAKDGKEAMSRMIKEVEGENTPRDFDPLMNLNNMINDCALRCGGLSLMMLKEDGSHYCPLCEAASHGVKPQEWIDDAADAILQYCKENRVQG